MKGYGLDNQTIAIVCCADATRVSRHSQKCWSFWPGLSF